jgi:hypothetical protein
MMVIFGSCFVCSLPATFRIFRFSLSLSLSLSLCQSLSLSLSLSLSMSLCLCLFFCLCLSLFLSFALSVCNVSWRMCLRAHKLVSHICSNPHSVVLSAWPTRAIVQWQFWAPRGGAMASTCCLTCTGTLTRYLCCRNYGSIMDEPQSFI